MHESISIVPNAIGLFVQLALPFLIATLVAAFVAGLLQAVTQIDERLLGFAARLGAVILVLYVGATKVLSPVLTFAQHVWGTASHY